MPIEDHICHKCKHLTCWNNGIWICKARGFKIDEDGHMGYTTSCTKFEASEENNK
jgi:hypothetical protein